ncbi:hypothetical protein B0T20DRAFT_318175, partial [Sordaria brevicollis]
LIDGIVSAITTLPGHYAGNRTIERLMACMDSKNPVQISSVLSAINRAIPEAVQKGERPLLFSDVDVFRNPQEGPAQMTRQPADHTDRQQQLSAENDIIGAVALPTAGSEHHRTDSQNQGNASDSNIIEVSYEGKMLRPPFPPPAPIHGPPLEVPYHGKLCNKCKKEPRWKKSALQCFGCRKDKATPEEIADIVSRARRGLGSCSNCFGPEDRGEGKHCQACHNKQVGKTQRFRANQKAKKEQEARAAR